jgi:hypothetical protein
MLAQLIPKKIKLVVEKKIQPEVVSYKRQVSSSA